MDARLRELEREAALGGPDAQERLAVARQRQRAGRGEVPREPRSPRFRKRSERLRPLCSGCGTAMGSRANTCWSCGARRSRSERMPMPVSGRVQARRVWRRHKVLIGFAVLCGVAYVLWGTFATG